MKKSRRALLLASGAVLVGLGGRRAQAAEGGSSRSFSSTRSILQIAKGLVLGIGREAFDYARSLGPAGAISFVERLDLDRFEADVPTLTRPINLDFQNAQFTVDGLDRRDKLEHYLCDLKKIAARDADQLVNAEEAAAVLALVNRATGEVLGKLDEGATLGLDYDVRYRQAYFHIINRVRRGRVRVELSLRQPVRMFNAAQFVVELNRCDDGTSIHTSLWADVCIGRREGPIVRRIAEREIGCRAAQFLAEFEREARVLVTDEGVSRLGRMIPELMRRIVEGTLAG